MPVSVPFGAAASLSIAVAVAVTAAAAVAAPSAPSNGKINGHHVIFHAVVHDHPKYANVWGYTAPNGREYALLGCYDGTAIIDITPRRASREVAFVPGPTSSWRELRTMGQWLYVVNETGGGLQIISLANPEAPAVVTPSWGGFTRAHTIHIDTATSTAFVAGRNGTGGVLILRLLQPTAPTVAGMWDPTYVHDMFARNGRMYAAAINEGKCYILSLANLASPSTLGVISGYPDAFTHNVWATDDETHVLTTDERGGAVVRMWNVTDPAHPEQTSFWSPFSTGRAIPHNVHVDGNLAYVSYYTAGVRVLDISDPEAIQEVGGYDTYPPNNSASFDGVWGVFPYYPNSPGLFVVSDIYRGLYVLELEAGAGVTDPPAPEHVALAANPRVGGAWPNPVSRGDVRVAFSSTRPLQLDASVVDASGRRVRRLTDRTAPAGETILRWDLRDDAGRPVPAGAYFVRVAAGDVVQGRRVIVTR